MRSDWDLQHLHQQKSGNIFLSWPAAYLVLLFMALQLSRPALFYSVQVDFLSNHVCTVVSQSFLDFPFCLQSPTGTSTAACITILFYAYHLFSFSEFFFKYLMKFLILVKYTEYKIFFNLSKVFKASTQLCICDIYIQNQFMQIPLYK